MIRILKSTSLYSEIFAFSKAQVSAFIGGLVDLAIMIIAVELFHFHYIHGIILGGIIGALVNFTINKNWTFRHSSNKSTTTIFSRFAITVIGSIVLKSFGTYLLSTIFYMDYKIARVVADLFVCFGFNYTMQRLWVFK